MKLGVLFSGGKDSAYATYLAIKNNHEVSCLITLISENKESYMFHTPSITKAKKQAQVMGIPQIEEYTKGIKEEELEDLRKAIKKAIERYNIEGIVTGAVDSIYQASRVQKICYDLKIECFNPLWQKNQMELMEDLLRDRFSIIITGVFAYPLGKEWVGRIITKDVLNELRILEEKYGISPAGEGGEFENFVLDCPIFKRGLKIMNRQIQGKGNSWRLELEVE